MPDICPAVGGKAVLVFQLANIKGCACTYIATLFMNYDREKGSLIFLFLFFVLQRFKKILPASLTLTVSLSPLLFPPLSFILMTASQPQALIQC